MPEKFVEVINTKTLGVARLGVAAMKYGDFRSNGWVELDSPEGKKAVAAAEKAAKEEES